MTDITEKVITNEIKSIVMYVTNIFVLILMLFHNSIRPAMAFSPCIHNITILMFLEEIVKRETGFFNRIYLIIA